MNDYCKHYKNGYCEIEQAHIPTSWCKERCRKNLPNIAKQASSFTKESIRYIKSGMPKRSPDEIDRVKLICKQCDYYQERNGSVRCAKCGCYLNIKTRWATADCPIGKWTVYDKNKSIFKKSDGSDINIIDLFNGQAVFLIGNGKSFANVDKTLLKQRGILTCTMNNGGADFKSDLWVGQDPPAKFVERIWVDPTIMKFTRFTNSNRRIWQNGKYGKYVKECPNVWYHHLKSEPKPDIWTQEDRINWSIPFGQDHRCSVFMAALHILYFLGFKRVYLIGTDFKMDAEKPYFFNEKQPQGVVNYNNTLFAAINNYLKKIIFSDFDIVNCTPDSGLDAFKYIPLEQAIEKEKIGMAQNTYGMYASQTEKDIQSSGQYKNLKKGIVYYTNNVIDGSLLDKENKMFIKDSGLDIVSVSHKPIDFGKNIVVDKPSCGQSLLEQVIIGIENSDADYIYLCEHDCLYHPSHFGYITDRIAYNSNVYSLNYKGYQHSKRLFPLSSMSGEKGLLLDAMKDKLAICKNNGGKIHIYEPGRGEGKYGKGFNVDSYESEFPIIDVRHNKTFTSRKVFDNHKIVNHLYFWDDHKTLKKRLGV